MQGQQAHTLCRGACHNQSNPLKASLCVPKRLPARATVLQVGCLDQEDVIRPYACLSYAWDEPTAPPRLEVQLAGRRKVGEFELDKVSKGVGITHALPPIDASQWGQAAAPRKKSGTRVCGTKALTCVQGTMP